MAQNDSIVGLALVTTDHCNCSESKAYENDCSVKKNKHKSKRSLSSDEHGGNCCAVALDNCSPSAVMKPNVKPKPASSCVKAAKKRLKPDSVSSLSNSASLSVSTSDDMCESLSVDDTVSSKRRKRKLHNAHLMDNADSTVKLKKSQTVDSKADEVCSIKDERSIVPNKCNFNIAQLRSALQQCGSFLDAASKQDTLCDKATLKDRTLQLQKESTSTEFEEVDRNMSKTSSSSPSADIVLTDSSRGSLKERMMKKLMSARFRFINEQMYRSTGSEAAEMFEQDKDAFAVYHAGFQSQVLKWPTNPIDRMIDYISGR